jgi:hypothetical protein
MFVLVRSTTATAWGIRASIPDALANELTVLAGDKVPLRDLHELPKHVDRYRALGTLESFGPAFEFPDVLPAPRDIVVVEDERVLDVNFRGWVPGEIAAGCAPVMTIVVDGHPVSICFCARRSDVAAEAGSHRTCLSRTWVRRPGHFGMGARNARIRSYSAVQHELDEHGIARGRDRAQARRVREHLEHRVNRRCSQAVEGEWAHDVRRPTQSQTGSIHR